MPTTSTDTETIDDIVVNFAKFLKKELNDDAISEKVTINIYPSIENGQITLAVSCFSKLLQDFSERLFWVTYNTLGDSPSPITYYTRFEKTKILSNSEQLKGQLYKQESIQFCLNILRTIAKKGKEENI